MGETTLTPVVLRVDLHFFISSQLQPQLQTKRKCREPKWLRKNSWGGLPRENPVEILHKEMWENPVVSDLEPYLFDKSGNIRHPPTCWFPNFLFNVLWRSSFKWNVLTGISNRKKYKGQLCWPFNVLPNTMWSSCFNNPKLQRFTGKDWLSYQTTYNLYWRFVVMNWNSTYRMITNVTPMKSYVNYT
jgi:hypothetical protein